MKPGWYYTAETGSFGEIFYHEGIKYLNTERFSYWGPFKTFTAAKKDAIDYFRTDIRDSQDAIKEIKAFKKVKK